MSKNLKIRRSPKAGYRRMQKVAKNIVENILQKMLFSNCHVKFIFPMTVAVAGSALVLILFCFHSVCCFMMPEKILVFKQIILFRKIWWGNRENMQDLFQRISGSGKWTQMVSNLTVENKNFLHYLKTYLSCFCLQSLGKIRFNLHRVGCFIRQISPLFSRC